MIVVMYWHVLWHVGLLDLGNVMYRQFVSSIYDSKKAIKHVLVVFFWVKTSPTHYQGAVLMTNGYLFLFFYPQAIYIKWSFVHMSGNK